VNDTLATLVVARALVQSYPTWTDEHGTNVEQLAAIAVTALEAEGLLVTADATRDLPAPSHDALDATTISLP
jgi:hypothetical protein